MMMAATLYQGAIPVDENTVRNTATPYNIDAPAAEAPNAPDRNEIETDSNPDLGMVNRQLGSHTIGMLKYAPPWIPDVNANADANDIINRQVSTSGTAAQREAAGQFGHGTILTTEGIEPVADLVDGGSMTNTYFTANDPEIQSSSGNFMSIAPGQDHTVPALVAGVGKEAARTAAMSSTYNAFYANVAGS
jgi:hypothetical protein